MDFATDVSGVIDDTAAIIGVLSTSLTALVGASDGYVVEAVGHTTTGDGGGGRFRWFLGSSTTADGGLVWGETAAGRW